MILLLALAAAGIVFAQTPDIVQVKRTPPVVVPGVDATLQVEVRTTGLIDRVTLNPAWAPATEIPFSISGQGAWTFGIPVATWLAGNTASSIYRPFVGFVRLYRGADRQLQYNLSAEIAPAGIPRVAITRVAADFQHTPYVANINLPAAFPDPAGAAPKSFANQELITNRFYQVFGDNFDQLDIVYQPEIRDNRFHYQVRVDAQGTGVPVMNNTARYGSRGTLLGINTFPIPAFFDGVESGYQHEFVHQWVSYLGFAPFTVGRPHWPISTMAMGIMGFSIPPTNEGGNFPCELSPEGDHLNARPVSGPKLFSDFDLYLMGLLPPEEAREQYVVTDNARATALTSNCQGQVAAGSFVRVRASDIIAGAGPRIPVAGVARRDFRRGTIVVTRDGLLGEDAMALYTYFSRRAEERTQVPVASGLAGAGLENPFYLSTGKRGTLNTQLTPVNWPRLAPGGVLNGASGEASIGQGSYVAIYGERLAAGEVSTPTARLPRTLGNVSVLVNGAAAPLYYVSPGQVNFQLPFETPVGRATVTVISPQGPSNAAWINVTAAAPGILIYGNNRAVAQNPDGNVNGPANPAAPDSVVTVYLTGIGPLSAVVATGEPAPADPLARATGIARATVGSSTAQILYLGLTPGFAGLAQLNLRIPAALAAGDYALQLTVGGAPSNRPLLRVDGGQ